MEHPLVHYDEGSFHLPEMGDGIFSQYSHSIRCDKLGNTVVDFRVNMIWPAAEDYSAAVIVLHPLKHFLALLLHVMAEIILFLPGKMGSAPYTVLGNGVFSRKHLYKLICKYLFRRKSHKGI